jgi:hypothetical protein
MLKDQSNAIYRLATYTQVPLDHYSLTAEIDEFYRDIYSKIYKIAVKTILR